MKRLIAGLFLVVALLVACATGPRTGYVGTAYADGSD